jgi:hypothetical protein
MKSRIIWAVVVLLALAGFYYATIRPTNSPGPGFSRKVRALRDVPPPSIPPPTLPAPIVMTPTLTPPPLPPPVTPPVTAKRVTGNPPPMEVPIQDNATIDFSIGAPVVRSGGKDQEALEKALKEMAEATKNTTFPPTKK